MRMRLFEKWSPASLSSYVMRAGKFIAPSLPIYQYDSGVIFRWREVQPGGRSLVTMDDHFPRAKDGTMGDEQADYGNYYNEGNVSHLCTGWAPILGMTGIVSAVAFANLGGAYGTAKAGQGLMAMGIRSPELLMKNIIPVVMAGVLGIYGLIVAVILNGKFTPPAQGGYATYSQYNGFSHLAAGMCCGLCSLASGIAIGIAADAGTRAVGAQSAMAASWKKMGFTGDAGGQVTSSGDALFVGTILIQVFASNLGLYGLITSLILSQTEYQCQAPEN